MRIHKIQIWRVLVQICEREQGGPLRWVRAITQGLVVDWLRCPTKQAEILRRERWYEEQTPYMPRRAYGIRRVYLWPEDHSTQNENHSATV